jgi:putative transposase
MSSSRTYDTQAHTKWDATFHVVIVPKYRKSILFQGIRKEIWDILKLLSKRFDVEIIQGNVWMDHIHMIIRIDPKYSVADIIWKLKWKSAIMIHNRFGKKKMLSQKSFWSRWYFVSTVWIDLEMIKKYVAEQWKQDKYIDWNQLDFWW